MKDKPLMRLKETSLIIALTGAFAVAAAPPTRADDAPPVGQQIVDQMYKVFGEHPGMRANHAKGLMVEGTFTPSKAGPALSKAILFSGGAVPVTVRFSDSTGIPTIPDGADGANPHGMAMKFHLAGGAEMDVVVNSLKFFPVATGEEFRDLLIAVSKTNKDTPKPTPVDQFMAAHPAAPKALGSTTTPVSWGQESYNGVDAFVFVDKAGKRTPFRFIFAPVAGEKHLSAADAAKQKPDFLTEEMSARLAKKPVQFRMMAQLAGPGDSTKDPTKPWPANRKVVDLGLITLNKVTPDNAKAQQAILFMPNNLVDGVEVSDDPLIQSRDEAYPVSFSKRTQ
jgi:catalase